MKKMYILLVALGILLLAIDINAQTYKPCLNEQTTIRVYSGMQWQDVYVDFHNGKIIEVDHRSSENSDVVKMIFREDQYGRVYEKVSDSETEILIIDMSLMIGDKFTFYEGEEAVTVASVYVKDSRKTIVFDKKLRYNSGDSYANPFTVEDSIKFIEGIGCNMGLLYRHRLDDGYYNQLMSGRVDRGEIVYEVNDPHFYRCNIVRKDKESYESIFGKQSTKFSVFVPMVSKGSLGTTGISSDFIFESDRIVSIGGILYNVGNNGWEHIREDKTTGRLYGYSMLSKKEYITCDMSLNIGDVFIVPYYREHSGIGHGYEYDEAGYSTVVDSISDVNGKKIIYFKPFFENKSCFYDGSNKYYLEQNISFKFIEGVGPIYGPCIDLWSWNLGLLLCIEKDGKDYYMTSEDLGCYQNILDVNENTETSTKIYPNPANNEINIDFVEAEEDDIDVMILNLLGNVVYQRKIKDDILKVDISHLSAAVYTVIITTNRGRSVSKFIKM